MKEAGYERNHYIYKVFFTAFVLQIPHWLWHTRAIYSQL